MVSMVASSQYLIDTRLLPAMDSLNQKGTIRDVNIDSLLTNGMKNGYRSTLMEIKVVDSVPLEPYVSAATFYDYGRDNKGWYYKATIQVEERVLSNFYNLENTLAHEIGHMLDLEHDEEDINAVMFIVIEKEEGLLYDLAYKSVYTKQRWDKYFNKLKLKYKLTNELLDN